MGNKPTPKPTTVREGCFSNNYKDCLPKLHSDELKSCNTVWLPNGPQQDCIALWGDCTDGSSSCCGGAVCSKEDDYTACVPPGDLTNYQIQNGFDCVTDTVRMNNKCNKDAKWTQKGWCRLSCYNAGNGYP